MEPTVSSFPAVLANAVRRAGQGILGARRARTSGGGTPAPAGPVGGGELPQEGARVRLPARPYRRRRGFTLLELVMAVAVLGIILAIAVPRYQDYREKARIAKASADIVVMMFDIRTHEDTNGKLPPTLQALGRGTILDPWGNPFQYLDFSTVKGKGAMRKDRFLVPINSTYDLYSMGKDGKTAAPLTAKDSQDDVIRANDGAFVGLASEY
jgi:general secretion pathway protein G